MTHTYKGIEFNLEFIQKDKLVIVIRTTFKDNKVSHPSEVTIFNDTLAITQKDSELKNKLCDLCLYSNKRIDAAGNFT